VTVASRFRLPVEARHVAGLERDSSASSGTRTLNQQIKSLLLYQLS
jgi:hypothetical protein